MAEAILLDVYAQLLLFDIQCTLLYIQQYLSSLLSKSIDFLLLQLYFNMQDSLHMVHYASHSLPISLITPSYEHKFYFCI